MFFKSLVFSKTKISLGGFFFEKNPMTYKIKKFLHTLEHLIPDGREEIPTFALYHPLLHKGLLSRMENYYQLLRQVNSCQKQFR